MSMSASDQQPENKQLDRTFLELRPWVDQRLVAKGLQPSSPPKTRGEAQSMSIADVEGLKADIATLIRIEGRRSFWSGLAVNATFFVLGLIGGVVVDIVKNASGWLL